MRTKRFSSMLLALMMLLSTIPFSVGAASSNGFEYTVSSGNTVTITGYTGQYKYVIIPSDINGHVVTSVGAEAFKNRTDIKSVTFPDTLEQINYEAFEGCTGLANITIPESVTYIGSSAFKNCTFVSNLYFNAVNASDFWSYGTPFPAFQNLGKNTAGTTLTFGPNVTRIPGYMFADSDPNVKTVLFSGDKVISIGQQSFEKCTALKAFGSTENGLAIPPSVQTIGIEAFSECTGVQNITIPESVSTIGNHAFQGCINVKHLYYNTSYDIKYSAWGMPTEVFENMGTNTDGVTVVFGKSVTLIPRDLFECDTQVYITKVIFRGTNIRAINYSAFDDCTYLELTVYCGTSSQWSRISIDKYNEPLTKVVEFHTMHDWGKQTVLQEPTCNGIGSFERMCDMCEITECGTLDALGHNVENWTLTADPLCLVEGEKEGVCTRCSSTIAETVPALGHNYIGIVTTEPTCTQDGVKTFTCGHCGDVYTETVPSLGGHVYDNGTITKEVTCTEYGTMTFICQNCGEPRVEILPAFGHSYDSGVVTTAPTCETDGIKTFTCATCAHTYTETLPAFGHTETMVTADATCTEDGYTAAVCTTCGNELSRKVIPAFGHTEITEVVDATCTEDGYTSVVCEVCKAELLHEVHSALGHSYDSGVVTTAPTCETDGIKTFTCAVCAHTYTETLSALGHTETTVSTEANCTQNGYVVVICTTCGDELSREIIPAYGHSYGDGTVTTAPTCEEEGIETFVCTVCAYVDTEVVPATGHTEATVTVDATCTEDGYVLTVCEVCEKELARQPIATLGHQYVSGFCTVCGHQNFQYGDANDDGRINSSDITRLLRYLANRDPMTGESSVVIGYGADCNGDGKISSTDVTRLLRYLANRDPMTGESSIVLGPTN